MAETPLQQTPLHDLHLRLGARLVPFAGYAMPVQYPTGLMAEHKQCRAAAALFDVSHMGQLRLVGADAAAALETLVPMDAVDLAAGRLLYEEWVAHGQGSGGDVPERFSNAHGSHQSSLGLFRTLGTYQGANGYSLRMEGLEPGINDAAAPRAIVVHGADYVDPDRGRRMGRLGRSWGCPAVRRAIARPLIDALSDGQFLFAYAPDPQWLRDSPYAACAAGAIAGGGATAGATASVTVPATASNTRAPSGGEATSGRPAVAASVSTTQQARPIAPTTSEPSPNQS